MLTLLIIDSDPSTPPPTQHHTVSPGFGVVGNLNVSFSGSFHVDESLKSLDPWGENVANHVWDFWPLLWRQVLWAASLLIVLQSFRILPFFLQFSSHSMHPCLFSDYSKFPSPHSLYFWTVMPAFLDICIHLHHQLLWRCWAQLHMDSTRQPCGAHFIVNSSYTLSSIP